MISSYGTDKATRQALLAARAAATVPRATLLAPFLLAVLVLTLTFTPRAEAYVYWANSWQAGFNDPTTIGRANPDGRRAKHGFLHLAGAPCGGLSVDETHIYWAQFVEIARANIDGTGVDPSFISGTPGVGLVEPCGVAVDGARVYWGNRSPQYGEDDAIGRANIDGTGANEFIAAIGSTCGLAVNATHIYWSYQPGTIGRANLDGTGVDRTFITNDESAQQTCGGLALDDDHIYWTNDFTPTFSGDPPGTIGRANLDGTGVEQSFISDVENPCGVAVDAAHVYWANFGPDVTGEERGTIGRANRDGTDVDETFITGAERPCGVAVDARPGFGKLKRNRRRGTAKLTMIVPGPGELRLAKTAMVKRAKQRAKAEGKVKLSVKPRGKAKKKLAAKGKAKVKATVTYTPDGGESNTQTKRLRLVKRR